MAANNAAWIAFWFLFFDRVGAVHGWEYDEVLVLLAVLTSAAGIVLGLFGNLPVLGPMISGGELDAALALPVPPLRHLLLRKVEPMHLGDLLTGVILFAFFCNPTPTRVAVFAFGVVCASLVLGGFLVLVGSLSFWLARNEAGDLGFHAVLLFGAYPVDIFSGVTRVLLYLVVPAGFISSVPARLVDDFDPLIATALTGVSIGVAFAATAVFNRGLGRYVSGAVWTKA